jgi:hypothetical protein
VCFGSFASLLAYLSMSAIRPISDLQFDVANTETGVMLAAIRIWLRAYESTPEFITHAPLDDEFNSLISATSTVPVADSVM